MTLRILITGVESGIGQATAQHLASCGHTVIGTVQNIDSDQNHYCQKLYCMELSSTHSVDRTIRKMREDGLQLDAIFLNAGYGMPGAVEVISTDAMREQFEVNVFANHTLIKAFLRELRSPLSEGVIIVNSSVLSFFNYPYRGAYSASKAALESIIGCLRAELDRNGSNIKVHSIQPGPVHTMFRKRSLLKWLNEVELLNKGFEHKQSSYEKDHQLMEKRLGAIKSRNAIDAFECAKAVEMILDAKRHTTVRLNFSTKLAWWLKRLLPLWAIHSIAVRSNP